MRGKLAVVRRFGISSLRKGRELAGKNKKPEQAGLAFPDYACHGGAFPIWIKVSPLLTMMLTPRVSRPDRSARSVCQDCRSCTTISLL